MNDRQARYLAQRDGKCRIPGCLGIGNTQAHHTKGWIATLVTQTSDLINLCNFHHGCHHDGDFTITGNPETTITITYNNGRILASTNHRSLR